MKLRRERRGLHFYSRQSGIHVLLDEYPQPPSDCHVGPCTVSIALTNACDLDCPFCYAPKTNHTLPSEQVLQWSQELDALGTLEVAFGGGEPALYGDLATLCRRIWERTRLGISMTTNGQHIESDLVDAIAGCLSIMRFSVDAPEPLYSQIRGRPLSTVMAAMDTVRPKVPIGVNTVVNSATLRWLDDMLSLVKAWQATEWLLLPEVQNGRFAMSNMQWKMLDRWISEHLEEVPLGITADARQYLSCAFLFGADDDASYAHISADGYLRRSSYGSPGVRLGRMPLSEALAKLGD